MDQTILEELEGEGCYRCGRVCSGVLLNLPAQRPKSLELLNKAHRLNWLGQWPSGQNSAKEVLLIILARALKDPSSIKVKDGRICINNAELGEAPAEESPQSNTQLLIKYVHNLPRAGGARYEGRNADALADQLYDDAWAALYSITNGTWHPGEFGPTCPTCAVALALPESGEVEVQGSSQQFEGDIVAGDRAMGTALIWHAIGHNPGEPS